MTDEPWVYQQDNAFIYQSVSTMKWFHAKNVTLLDWPSQNPDLNSMQNLWGILVRRVYSNARQFRTTNDLKLAITNAWLTVTADEKKCLVNSMEQRIFDLIKNNGGGAQY